MAVANNMHHGSYHVKIYLRVHDTVAKLGIWDHSNIGNSRGQYRSVSGRVRSNSPVRHSSRARKEVTELQGTKHMCNSRF